MRPQGRGWPIGRLLGTTEVADHSLPVSFPGLGRDAVRILPHHSVKEELKQALSDARTLWFLCSGNVVRSAFAEVYARHRGCPIAVRSAATRYRNTTIFPETISELKARGVGRLAIERFEPVFLGEVNQEMDPKDVVLGMTPDHLDICLRYVDTPRELRQRAFLLGDAFWVSEEIADPVEDGADFSRTFERIAKAVDSLLVPLKELGRGVARQGP